MGNILINALIAFLIGSLLLGFQRKVMARIQKTWPPGDTAPAAHP